MYYILFMYLHLVVCTFTVSFRLVLFLSRFYSYSSYYHSAVRHGASFKRHTFIY